MATDTTIEKFKADVIDASMEVPVLVDFWASWCAPCKTLGPMLEKLEREYAGRFKLVKVDSDKQQQLSQHFKVKSLPTVFAVVQGRPVDQFSGAVPESKLREFIDRLMPNPAEIELDHAGAAMEQGDLAKATDHVRRALALDPSHDSAKLMYAQLLLEAHEPAAAQAQLDTLSREAKADPQVQALAEQVKAEVEASRAPRAPALEAKLAANANDLQARLDLAEHYIGYKAWPEAMEHLLAIVQRDRKFQDDIGRKRMIEVFNLASAQPALVSEWRRKLSSSLF